MGRRTTPHATTQAPLELVGLARRHDRRDTDARFGGGHCSHGVDRVLLASRRGRPPARIVTSPNEASNARSPATFSAHRAQSTASRTKSMTGDRSCATRRRVVEGEALRDGVAHRIAHTVAITDEPAELHREADGVRAVNERVEGFDPAAGAESERRLACRLQKGAGLNGSVAVPLGGRSERVTAACSEMSTAQSPPLEPGSSPTESTTSCVVRR